MGLMKNFYIQARKPEEVIRTVRLNEVASCSGKYSDRIPLEIIQSDIMG